MSVRITTLSENTALLGFLGEWGLSVLIETDTKKVLLDTGMSISAVQNADLLGFDFSTLDAIVLSHAHADHTGGLRDVLRRVRKEIEVVAHPDIWIPKYVAFGDWKRYAGMPFLREELEAMGAQFTLTSEPYRVCDEVMTTGEVEVTVDFEPIDDRLCIKLGDELVPDPMPDDLAVVVKTGEGLALITGCAHRGIINTVRHVQKITDGEYIHTILGGTHLHLVPQERIDKPIAELKELGLQRLGVSHCTGFHSAAALAREFGEIFFTNNAGTQLMLE
jgi:7,8-dihydropterin-6-yl-methyl-4-(beta-D-ribofuranosyl)aminobenzene 5'-phosphate synthase